MSKHQEWQNGNFEEYIRQKSQEGQLPDFDQAAWASMEKMLDTHMPVEKGPSRGGGFSARGGRSAGLMAALLISAVLGWYLFSSYTKKEQLQPQRQQQVQLKGPGTSTAAATSRAEEEGTEAGAIQLTDTNDPEGVAVKPASPLIADQNKGAAGGAEEDVKATESSTSELGSGAGNSSRIQASRTAETARLALPEAATAHGAAQTAAVNSKGNTPAMEHSSSSVQVAAAAVPETNEGQQSAADHAQKPAAAQKAVEHTANAGVQQPEKQQAALNRLPQISAQSWMPMSLDTAAKTPALPLLAAEPKAGADTGAVVKKLRSTLPLSVSLTLAPDFTGTGQAGSVKWGAGAGVHLEYFFLKRVSLLSGAFYSKKNYMAGGDFSPYGESWQHGYAPDYVDASCGVIDIPLNLRYYLYQKNRHRFFVSTGASSYLMQREEYYMVYDSYYYDDYTYEVRNEHRHFMAAWNLSLGYERAISERWSLQAEPFLKVPIKGVGAGTAKLNSMGFFIHLKYNFMRRTND
ncbi:outer membrane beta-barrel protein [Cesiribacter sp. SM1]|uniref:outer membrane beta-barrel protein n=1 Tax=Cesiribacter sp. SM1 TaxID=2861196 RepID=UPI001CD2761C|nr:outer membrane beta-barrel protein [Cesiribacter sp. SM1]